MVTIQINNRHNLKANRLTDVRIPGSINRSIKMAHEIKPGDNVILNGECILVQHIEELDTNRTRT